MNSTFWAVAAPTAVCLLLGVALVPTPGTWPCAFRATGRLLATLGRYLFSRCGCPDCGKARPLHGPVAKAMRSAPSGLSDDEEARWRVLRKQLDDIPEPRNGDQR